MKKMILGVALMAALCGNEEVMAQENPFFKEFDTPYGSVPFSKIKNSDYMPAIDRGLEIARAEVDAIANNQEAPTFQNTIEALDAVGDDLDRVANVFFNILEANSDDELMELSLEASKKLSDYSSDLILNQKLWERVKAVHDTVDASTLTPEQATLLKKTYDSFANSGANLLGEDRETYKKLTGELSELTTVFGQNVLKELNTYEIWLTSDDLGGLPETLTNAAAEAAKEKGREGEYLFTLAQPTYMAFMKYSDRQDLRENMYKMYMRRNTQGQYSNVENAKRIAALRLQIANLLGFETYAHQKLQNTMAETPEAVYNLLDQLRDAYLPAEQREMAELEAFASKLEGREVKINPWDYSYYSNKLKAEKYSFDEEAMRPYFPLDKVKDGVFGLAHKLYGLNFELAPEVEPYHPDVVTYKVTDANGTYLGLLYTDFFPRPSKRPGAWMTSFKEQWTTTDGQNSRPLVSIVMNFNKPTADKPALLTPYEVETFLHEFGHSLHGLLANTRYKTLSGTSVYRDFVELPSQFNENYLTEKEWLDGFATHYETGDSISQQMIDRLVAASRYGAAYACLRQLMFGYIDMAWHSIKEPVEGDAREFEERAYEGVAMFPSVDGAMVSTQFNHIFSGGYAAGYYSYKWAEVLDADAFAHFKENGIFDPETAASFRRNILERGGTEHPSELYRRFRGQDATIDALLIRDGIKDEPKVTVPPVTKD
ncbi:MAG: M3 family metallopeptidase [Bacteroidales bacterium]|nr:M3 family metallopeptidase [Bacteroidales bacterium]